MHFSFALLLVLPIVTAFCPIHGPAFPAPKNHASSKVFQAALEKLSASIDAGRHDPNSEVTNASTVSVQMFSAYSENPLFTLHREGSTLNTTAGVKKVNSDSIWRIASISKLIIVYLTLKELGDRFWDTPVAEVFPELREDAKWRENQVNFVDWESVTLGNLAGQTSGIAKDVIYVVGANPLMGSRSKAEEFGLSALPADERPSCSIFLEYNCTRAQFLAALDSRQPVFAPNSPPLYSNTPYAILGYALESITGKSLQEILQSFVDELKLDVTSPVRPDASKAMIPYSVELSGFLPQSGDVWPLGGLYSNFNDLAKIGRSILNSKFTSTNVTRAWLKPTSFTSDLRSAVGRPWEIYRVDTQSMRGVIDVYGKGGDLGPYSTFLGLVPDYNFGFVTGVGGGGSANWLSTQIAEIILPALEETARVEAHEAYAGTYTVNTNGTNSSIVLTTEAGKPGLSVTTFTSRGVDVLKALGQLYEEPVSTDNFRLVPTNLEQGNGNSTEVAWKFIENTSHPNEKKSPWSACPAWFNVDNLAYGHRSLDAVVFTLGSDGKAIKIRPRAYAVDYHRVK